MTLVKLEQGALGPIYEDTGNSLGFYRILPGFPPYVCLNERLLDGAELIHKFVFNTLSAYQGSIPKDSKLFVTGHVCYLEELVPPEGIPLPEPELVIIGRAMRRWQFLQKEEIRTIGRTG